MHCTGRGENKNDAARKVERGSNNKMKAVSMKIAAAILGAAALQTAAASEGLNANWAYVLDSQSDVVTSGYTGECVRTQWWTPALAAAHPQARRCTPDLVPKPQPVSAPATPAAPSKPPEIG